MTSLSNTLRALLDDPPRAGAVAASHRPEGARVRIIEALPANPNVAAQIERDGVVDDLDAWPRAEVLATGDLLTLQVGPAHVDAYCAYLEGLSRAHLPSIHIAPWCVEPRGIHRLWCISAARVALPPQVHIAARHDLIGIRVAQVALGFGATTLAGPIEPDRSLPLAGVTRPTENTRAGLRALIEQTGLRVEETRARI